MFGRYCDLEDISASNVKLNVTAEKKIPNLGFLDPSNQPHEKDLNKNAKLDLPAWFIYEYSKATPGVSTNFIVNVPRSYNGHSREILEANANTVDLHKWGPYFYQSGMQLVEFGVQDKRQIAKSLIQTFLQRFDKIMDQALHGETPERSKLDKWEVSLFQTGRDNAIDIGWARKRSYQAMENPQARRYARN